MDFEKLTNKSKELVQDVVNLASRKNTSILHRNIF